jgi:hypothetical protein
MNNIRSINLLAKRYARWLTCEAFAQHGELSKRLRQHAIDLKHYAEQYRYDSDAIKHICREARGASLVISALYTETGHKHFDMLGLKHLADACEEMQRWDIQSAKLCLDCAHDFLRKPDPEEYDGIEDDSAGGRY